MDNTDTIIVASHTLDLAVQIALQKSFPLVIPHITTFADGEIEVIFPDPSIFINKKVIIVHPTCPPVANEMIKLALISDAIHFSGSREVIALISYLGYARHIKGVSVQIPPAAQTIIHLLEAMAINKFVCVELHDDKDATFFKKSIASVRIAPLIAQYLDRRMSGDYCIVAPDHGAQERAQEVAKLLNKPLILYLKKRIGVDKVAISEPSNFSLHQKAVIIDDIIDTGGTSLHVANDLTTHSIKEVYGCFVHGIFSKESNIPLLTTAFHKIFVSNTVPLAFANNKIEVFDVSSALLTSIE